MSSVEQSNVKRGRGRPRRLSGSVMCGDDLLLSLLEEQPLEKVAPNPGAVGDVVIKEEVEEEGVRGTQSPEVKRKGKGVRLSAEEKEEKKAALKKEKEEKKAALKKEKEEKKAALKKEKEAEKLLKKEALKKEKEDKKEALKKEKEDKKEALKKEKEEKKAALKKEKEEKKEALKKEKAAEKAAKKAANKAAKKAENKAENKAAKKAVEKENEGETLDELQSEKYVEEGAELEVRMFEHEGVQWLKDDNNVLYSPETHKEVARWDPEEQAVMV